MKIKKEKELSLNDDKIVLLRLINKNNLEILLTNYGASLLSIIVPDKNENKTDITIGYNSIEDMISNHNKPEKYYFGCTVGRFANRIGKAQFRIKDQKFQLSKNAGDNHLHGGFSGLNKKIWDYKISEENNTAIFSCKSPDGEEGYPGNLDIELAISLSDLNEIKFSYKATSDAPTPINLTNHTYFNLNGGKHNILNHSIRINSDSILETDESYIPTGELIPLSKSQYDFNELKKLGDCALMKTTAYDNSFVLNKADNSLDLVAEISEENNPIKVAVYTTEPSIQLYSANGFDGSFIGKNNIAYQKYFGVCMETQNFPDSPNHKSFPKSILNPGELYIQETIYKIKF